MAKRKYFLSALAPILFLLFTGPLQGDGLKNREFQMAQYKQWLDTLGPRGIQLWTRIDKQRRPYRIYLGKEFFRADFDTQKWFVEFFSSYLAGHPHKSVIIDLFDSSTERLVGEYGWAGFRLYAEANRIAERVRPDSGQE